MDYLLLAFCHFLLGCDALSPLLRTALDQRRNRVPAMRAQDFRVRLIDRHLLVAAGARADFGRAFGLGCVPIGHRRLGFLEFLAAHLGAALLQGGEPFEVQLRVCARPCDGRLRLRHGL